MARSSTARVPAVEAAASAGTADLSRWAPPADTASSLGRVRADAPATDAGLVTPALRIKRTGDAADDLGACADAVLARVVLCARVVVVAAGAVLARVGDAGGHAADVGALLALVAGLHRPGLAGATLAGVVECADVAVLARRARVNVLAGAGGDVADLALRAGDVDRPLLADAGVADVGGALVAGLARRAGQLGVDAARRRIAGVGGARVVVVAVPGHAGADAVIAGVVDGTRVVVVAASAV